MSGGSDSFSSCAALAARLAAAATRREAEVVLKSAPLVRPMPASPSPASATGQVGIWRRTAIDGQTTFVRTADPSEHLWARLDRIGPKRAAKRVVFLGESCARGWPLDPLFNCVMALQRYIDTVAGAGTIEIIDLARCGIGPSALIQLLDASIALEPDAFVIFAGNNWYVDHRRLDFRGAAAALSETKRWRAVGPHCEQASRRQIAQWMNGLAAAARRRPSASTVFVVPAQEPAEFRLPSHMCNPLLASADQRHRDDLLERTERLRIEGDLAGAEACAARLADLEDGVGVAALQALGRIAAARGAHAEATRLFAEARDVATSMLSGGGLLAYEARLDELRGHSKDAGFHIVDLPRIFGELAGDPAGEQAPGRELFLDHAHMTARGILLAMAATAERMLPLLGLPAVSREKLIETPVEVEPSAEAQAHFTAAHFAASQPEVARYHFARACESSDETLDLLLRYVELRLSSVPMQLRDAYPALEQLQPSFPGIIASLRARQMAGRDARVMELIGQIIGEFRPEALGWYRDRVRREYSVGQASLDLLPFVRAGDVFGRSEYLRCFHYQTHFEVIAGPAPRPWHLRLTTRARESGSIGKSASLYINGALVQTWPMTHAWSTVDCIVESHLIEEGINTLRVVWPDPEQRAADRLDRLVRALTARAPEGSEALAGEPLSPSDIYIVWGEIHAFTARTADEAVAPGESRMADAPVRVAAAAV